MDFSFFPYVDNLMSIIIKPYIESTGILRFHVEKVLACMIFHTSGILESIERFH